MSESIYLGHVNISTDIRIKGRVMKIKNDLTPMIKRVLAKIIIEKNTSIRLNNKKMYCHLSANKVLHNAIKNIGIVKKKLFISKLNLIKLSAQLENLLESEDV
tara:strand:- start:194 stop:502 length:309 start_codon:yes stop_codon:yes gene_type:complete